MASNFWTSTHCNHWIIPRDTLNRSTTSDIDHLTLRETTLLHIFFASVISKLGKKLALRHVPIHTAIVYFRRFYLVNGFCETNPWIVVAACVYVAAKVEETPVHIKTVMNEARAVFAEFGLKSVPANPAELARMEFYLLEDLHFDLVIFHPYRSLLVICNREPANSGADLSSTGQRDARSGNRGSGVGRKRKRGLETDDDEESGLDGMGVFGEAAGRDSAGGDRTGRGNRAALVNERNGVGSGADALEVEDSVVQMAWFILNDTYRTDLILLHPPHVIALAALYLSFSLSDTRPDAPSYRVKGKRWIPLEHVGLDPAEHARVPVLHGGRGLLTRFDAPEWFAGVRVGLGVLLEAVQEIVSVYALWEELDVPGMVPSVESRNATANNSGSGGRPLSKTKTTTMDQGQAKSNDVQKITEKELLDVLQRAQLKRSENVRHPDVG